MRFNMHLKRLPLLAGWLHGLPWTRSLLLATLMPMPVGWHAAHQIAPSARPTRFAGAFTAAREVVPALERASSVMR